MERGRREAECVIDWWPSDWHRVGTQCAATGYNGLLSVASATLIRRDFYPKKISAWNPTGMLFVLFKNFAHFHYFFFPFFFCFSDAATTKYSPSLFRNTRALLHTYTHTDTHGLRVILVSRVPSWQNLGQTSQVSVHSTLVLLLLRPIDFPPFCCILLRHLRRVRCVFLIEKRENLFL